VDGRAIASELAPVSRSTPPGGALEARLLHMTMPIRPPSAIWRAQNAALPKCDAFRTVTQASPCSRARSLTIGRVQSELSGPRMWQASSTIAEPASCITVGSVSGESEPASMRST
jgi:hypothetical protein